MRAVSSLEASKWTSYRVVINDVSALDPVSIAALGQCRSLRQRRRRDGALEGAEARARRGRRGTAEGGRRFPVRFTLIFKMPMVLHSKGRKGPLGIP